MKVGKPILVWVYWVHIAGILPTLNLYLAANPPSMTRIYRPSWPHHPGGLCIHMVRGRRVAEGVHLQVNMMSLTGHIHTPLSQPRLDPNITMNPVLWIWSIFFPRSMSAAEQRWESGFLIFTIQQFGMKLSSFIITCLNKHFTCGYCQ